MVDLAEAPARPDPRGPGNSGALTPYVPRLVVDWLSTDPQQRHRTVEGTLLFADISGFTRLTERLSRLGQIGAEEMSEALNGTFGELLAAADADGADLLKWGGDAVLLIFTGDEHEARAARAAFRMRATLRVVGRLDTSAGKAVLRMSQGLHSGPVELFLVGDDSLHRELVVCGPGVTAVVGAESAADAGQILLGRSTAARLAPAALGAAVVDGARLLRREPEIGTTSPTVRRAGPDLGCALPAPIRRHLLHGAAAPEHRQIAVAFVSYSGTDEMLRRSGPEAVAGALDHCIRTIARSAADHEVTFFEGDIAADGGKVMLTAGAPTSAGHDAERLLLTVRRIIDEAGELPARAGVNDGFVFAGDFGPDFRRTYSVKGDAINLAARLCARAAPGQVLATTSVTGHSDLRFRTRELPPFVVKGKARPVTAVDVGPAADRDGGLSSTPLVGRAEELAIIRRSVAGLGSGTGSVLHVLGEAGIGKSRLLSELLAAAPEARALTVSCEEYEASTPYHSMRTLVRALVGLDERTPPAQLVTELDQRLRVDAPELVGRLPLLGTVLDLPVPDTDETRGLSDEFRRRRVEETVAELFGRLLPGPTVIVVDDAQHLDAASAGVLDRLLRLTTGHPWLVALAQRSDPQGWEAPPDHAVTTIPLRPLDSQDSARLLVAATADHPLPRSSLATLATRAAGNPLFLESLALAVGPAGGVESLPHSVRDLVTVQLDRLVPSDRTVLRYASVLGTQFHPDQLPPLLPESVAEPDETTYRRLDDFLTDQPDGSRRFRHSLLREVAYQGLPYRTRRILHDRVGREMEAGDPDRSPELLSLHFFQAGRYDKSWDYSLHAGRLARKKFANQEAVDLLGRALESARRGPRGMVPAAELGTVLEELGDTWFVIGLTDQAADAYRRARRELGEDPVRRARVVAKEARIDQRLRRLPQSLRRVTRALNELEQVPGRWASSARSLLCMRYAISRFAQGRVEEALRWGDQAARDAEESTDKATLAQAYATLHGIYVAAGMEPPMPYGELALHAYTELEDLPHQADCTNNIAVSALDHNRWVEAAESFGEAAAIYRRIGDTQGEGLATYNRAEVLVRQGHLDAAVELLEETLRTGRSVSDQELVALVRREQGRISCRLGRSEDGLAILAEAREIFGQIGEAEEIPGTDLAICEGLLLAGDDHGALDLADRLLDTDGDEPVWRAGLHHLRGHALLRVGEEAAATDAFETGVKEADANDDRYGYALNLLGLVALTPDAAEAANQSAEAWSQLRSLGVVELPVGLSPRGTAPSRRR